MRKTLLQFAVPIVALACVIPLLFAQTVTPPDLAAGTPEPPPDTATVLPEPPAIVPDALAEMPAEIPAVAASPEMTAATPAAEAVPAPAVVPVNANQEAVDQEEILIPPDQRPIEGAEATTNATSNLISITLDDVALEDVIRMFTRISGANIVASATNLEGRVTVNLTNVEWKPALESILEMHNLALTERSPGSEVYSIVPRAADAPEPMVQSTIFLDYTTVTEVTPVLRPMLVPGATISEFSSRNAFVVQSTKKNISEIEALVKTIDILSKQVCIETKFMELDDTASKKLGIRWDSLDEFGMKLGAGPMTWQRNVDTAKTRDDTFTQYDRRNQNDTVNELYDKFNDQYEVERVEIVERPDGSYVEIRSLDPTRQKTDVIEKGQEAQVSTLDQFSKTIAEQQSAIMEFDTLSMVLSALKKTDGVSIISNPKLIVTSGSTNAFFSVGEREPIIRTEIQRGTVDSPGDKEVAKLDTDIKTDYIQGGYLRTGIDLQVLPVVKTDDLIETEIIPSLRRFLENKTVGENSWPIISVKEIRTRFTLRSGQTVAIGGLTDSKDSKKVSKVPLLGDIPIIGKYFFSHTDDYKKQTETIIFVTLSLAAADTLREETGIPEDARLVHQRLIKSKAEKQHLQEAAETTKDIKP